MKYLLRVPVNQLNEEIRRYFHAGAPHLKITGPFRETPKGLEVGLFEDRRKAQAIRRQLKNLGIESEIIGQETLNFEELIGDPLPLEEKPSVLQNGWAEILGTRQELSQSSEDDLEDDLDDFLTQDQEISVERFELQQENFEQSRESQAMTDQIWNSSPEVNNHNFSQEWPVEAQEVELPKQSSHSELSFVWQKWKWLSWIFGGFLVLYLWIYSDQPQEDQSSFKEAPIETVESVESVESMEKTEKSSNPEVKDQKKLEEKLEEREKIKKARKLFEEGLIYCHQKQYIQCEQYMSSVLELTPDDRQATRYYIEAKSQINTSRAQKAKAQQGGAP